MDAKDAYYDIKETPIWYIDKIPAFCVNLERRPDRWQQFVTQPGIKALPNVKQFMAVDGSTIDYMNDDRIPLYTKKNIKNNTRRAHEEISTVGAIGCALSHIAIWEWIVQNQAAITLVFEDDAKVPNNFGSLMNELIERSSTLKDTNRWELCVLSQTKGNVQPIPQDPLMSTTDGFVGTHCYLITLECAKRFLKDAYVLHLHIDLWMAVFKQINGLKIVCPSTFFVPQRKSPTDVQEANYCTMCDVPTTFYKTHTMMLKEEKWLLHAMEFALSCMFLYAGYRFITRKS